MLKLKLKTVTGETVKTSGYGLNWVVASGDDWIADVCLTGAPRSTARCYVSQNPGVGRLMVRAHAAQVLIIK